MQATELSENEIVYLCRAHHVGLGSKSGRHQTRRVNMSIPDPLPQRSTYSSYTRKREDQDGVADSSDPEQTPSDKKNTRHRRNYQACEPCRERKVKCDLGDVDNPTAGPCAKCARESKDCYFSNTRKKGAGGEGVRPAKRARTGSSNSARTLRILRHSSR